MGVSKSKENIDMILNDKNNRFIFSLVTNEDENSEQVVVLDRETNEKTCSLKVEI